MIVLLLKAHELIQLTDNEKLILYDGMDQKERCIFYYKLMEVLKKKGLYFKVANRIDGIYLYEIGNLEDIEIC